MVPSKIKLDDTRPRITYTVGAVATSVFPVPFPYFYTSAITVSVDGTLRPPESYSVTGGGNGQEAGGVVTLATPVTNCKVTIRRVLPLERMTDYAEGAGFKVPALNSAEARTVALMQQLRDETIRISAGDPDVSVELPPASVRAGKALGFDAEGAMTATESTVDEIDAAVQARIEEGAVLARFGPFVGDGETTTFDTGVTLVGRFRVVAFVGGLGQHSFTVSGTNVVFDDPPPYGAKVYGNILAATGDIPPSAEFYDDAPAALGVASPGTSVEVSRGDHVHAMPTAAQVGAAAVSHNHAVADVTGLQAALDGKAAADLGNVSNTNFANKASAAGVGGGAAVGSATPQALGTAAAGSASAASREDHVHSMPSAADVGAAPASHTHVAANISDSTAAGRAVLTAADAAAQRTALGLGTISTQAASSVAITGGTINGTAIGATTASTGRFTHVDFVPTGTPPAYAAGRVFYDTTDGSLTVYGESSATSMQLGQEIWVRSKNATGAQIDDGTVVYISGAVGASGVPEISKARSDSLATSRMIGVTTQDIAVGDIGAVTLVGKVRGIDTSAWAEGTQLYLSSVTAGALTSTAPQAPDFEVPVAVVINQHATNGSIVVIPASPRLGFGSATPQPLGIASAGTANALSRVDHVHAMPSAADVGAASASSVLTQGKHTIWMPAAAMTARTTNGAAAGTTETTTNKVMRKSLDFDTATQEYAQFTVAMPKSWNEGTFTFQALWTATGGSGGVAWSLQAVAAGDGDALDAAFGTAQTVTDTLGTASAVHQTAESASITAAGSPAENDLVIFQISRAVSDGADTLAQDALLLGVRLFYTINAGSDA